MAAPSAIPLFPHAVNLAPTPLSAAVAGAFSAWALPTVSQWLGSDADTSFNYVIAFLLLVALPAHAGVLGLRRQPGPAVGRVVGCCGCGVRSLDAGQLAWGRSGRC
jgi:hypothetical protein